ncbi:putative pentatricopeptide repeat-containing protein-like [Capsicum annuum]|nr:putative pentatricopeptide repeat-containing protein-like [Capsicum annuum]KAF3627918.1 putative pentatricopeptide repeat-containing protein-like [Capsicum annuum]
MRIYRKRYLENEVSVLGGLLCFYSTANYQGEGTFNIWVMRDYGIKESWTNLYTIRDTDLYSARPKYRLADGEMLLSFRHLNRISLGPIFGTSKGQYFGLWPQCDTSREGFAYTESLISPKLLT